VAKSSVILFVGAYSRELAPQNVLDAMFLTISVRLESRGRGTRFPVVMEDVSAGYLKHDRAAAALRELQEIQAGMRIIPVSDVVWRLGASPNDAAGKPVNPGAVSAQEYFVGGDGQPLLSSIRAGVEECLRTAQALRLASPPESRGMFVVGLSIAACGVAWLALGRAIFPNWCLRSFYSHTAAMPIWTFGMYLVMIGAALLIATKFPGIGHWFRRRPAALTALALILPIAWLLICARAGFLPD
jgi:Immunity protein 70